MVEKIKWLMYVAIVILILPAIIVYTIWEVAVGLRREVTEL